MEKSQLRSGVVLSYINLAISSLIPFFYTPIMLNILGQEEYGLFSLASSTVSYLTLLSFGFGSTIVRYISKYRAQNNKEAVESTYGFFLLLYCGLGILVLFSGFIIISNVDSIFGEGLQTWEVIKMKKLIVIMTFNCALSFPISVFSSMITSFEKYFYKKLVDMIATIVAPLSNLVVLYLGFASIGMATVSTVIQLVMLPLNMWYCYNRLQIKPTFIKISKKVIKEMLGFSVFIFIGTIVDMLFWATDKVILGMLVGSAAVAVYNIGGTFNNMIMNLSTSISSVLTPKITGMVVTNTSKDEWSSLFIKVGRLQFIIIALIVSGFTVFGQPFILLWAGSEYEKAYWITILTMYPLVIPLIQNTGLSIVTAQNKHQFRSIVYLLIAILNVISTYLIVPYTGGIGAAICSCISYILGQGIIMNVYYYKVTGIDVLLFWKNIIKMGRVPIGLMITGIMFQKVTNINNWWFFFCGVIIYTLMYIILMFKYSLNEYEKDVFFQLVSTLKKVLLKCKYKRIQ